MSVHRTDFEETKYMSFLIKDNTSLEKYNETWEKNQGLLKKDLIVSLYIMKKIHKPIQLFIMMKCQKMFSLDLLIDGIY